MRLKHPHATLSAPQWGILHYHAQTQHLFVKVEGTGFCYGSVCGLWSPKGGIAPDVVNRQTTKCRRCAASSVKGNP